MRIGMLHKTLNKVILFGVQASVFLCVLCVCSFAFAQEGEEKNLVAGPENDTQTIFTEEEKGETQVFTKEVQNYSTDFSVSPMVANEKAKPRDIIKKELLVTNNTSQRMDLYIHVENIDPTVGVQEFVSPGVSDLSTSLANWVEITRGVIELSAGETRKIPYLIHVNLTAKPGNYYARIQFNKGPKRSEAEVSKEGTALMLNLEVQDDAKERLQLGNFISEDGVILGDTVSFSYLLENIGNRLIEPRGSIRIFNRRGEEVGSVPLNANGEEINPDNKKQLAAAWNATGRFGKYKAFLDLEYGENQLASVQDTVYFWVFPWKEIMVAFVGVLVLAVVGTYIVHMRSIAQPVQVRANRQRLPETDSYRQQPVYSHIQHITPQRNTVAPNKVVQNRQVTKHVTVLRSGNTSQNMQKKGRVINRGSTIELSHKNVQQTKTQGNVVQLQPRR